MKNYQSKRSFMWFGLVSMMILVTGMTGCEREAPIAEDEAVLARVGSEVITVSEFELEMLARSSQRPGQFAELEQRERLLDEMVRWRALVAEATDRGIDREPEIRRMIERLLVQRLRDVEISSELEQIVISDAEVAEFYASHEHEFARPARTQGAIVFVAAGSNAEARAAARQRIDEALAASSELPPETLHFGAVATDFSEDRASRYRGGVIGWLIDRPERAYRWDGAVVDALFALETPGDIAPVIETDEGFYLVRLAAHNPSRSTPLEQVAYGIRHRMLRERQSALEKNIHENLTAHHAIEINRSRLQSIQPPEEPAILPDPESATPPRPPGLPGNKANVQSVDDTEGRENDA